MNGSKQWKSPHKNHKNGVKFEEAMEQAFTEIFQNLKVIDEGAKKQREKLDLQRRRGSAPATMLRETARTFKQPRKKLERTISTPPAAASTSSAIQQPVNRDSIVKKRAKQKSAWEADRGGNGTEKECFHPRLSSPKARSVRRVFCIEDD